MKSAPWVLSLALFLLPAISAAAQEPQTQPASREHRDELIAKARQRASADRAKYSPEQLKECEDLYQVANKNWRSDEAATCLKVMIERFPDVNRTGCAALYLAQYARGDERMARLQEVIERYSGCYYLNGVQVGAYARFLLAGELLESGDVDGAQQLFDELNRDFPGAITHKGILICDRIAQIRERMKK